MNVGIYLLWLRAMGSSAAQVAIGVALGSVVALGFNYLVSRTWIFK
jgi:hypothetical protein